MLIGLCGTHGTGKSTVLQSAKEAGFNVDESQLSRTAQRKLGWDKLSIAEESFENVLALQCAILEAMYDRDQRILESGKLTLVERTPADVWAYMSMWSDRLINKFGYTSLKEIDHHRFVFKNLCRNMSNSYAEFIIVPPVEQIKFVEEPNRADLKSRNFVEKEINDFINTGNLPNYTIAEISKEDRYTEIVSRLALLNFKNSFESKNDN